MCEWKENNQGIYENEKNICCYYCIDEIEGCEYNCLHEKRRLNKSSVECYECKYHES